MLASGFLKKGDIDKNQYSSSKDGNETATSKLRVSEEVKAVPANLPKKTIQGAGSTNQSPLKARENIERSSQPMPTSSPVPLNRVGNYASLREFMWTTTLNFKNIITAYLTQW